LAIHFGKPEDKGPGDSSAPGARAFIASLNPENVSAPDPVAPPPADEMVEISWNGVKQQRRMHLGRIVDRPDVSMPERGTFAPATADEHWAAIRAGVGIRPERDDAPL